MLDSIYHMTINLFQKRFFSCERSYFAIYATLLRPSIHNVTNIRKPLVVYGL